MPENEPRDHLPDQETTSGLELRLRAPNVRQVLEGQVPLGPPWSNPEPGILRTFNPNTGEFTVQDIIVQWVIKSADL